MEKKITFEILREFCKHRCGENCDEEDNFSGMCNESECPIWNELNISDE